MYEPMHKNSKGADVMEASELGAAHVNRRSRHEAESSTGFTPKKLLQSPY